MISSRRTLLLFHFSQHISKKLIDFHVCIACFHIYASLLQYRVVYHHYSRKCLEQRPPSSSFSISSFKEKKLTRAANASLGLITFLTNRESMDKRLYYKLGTISWSTQIKMNNTTFFSMNTTNNSEESFDIYDLDSVLDEVHNFKTVSLIMNSLSLICWPK